MSYPIHSQLEHKSFTGPFAWTNCYPNRCSKMPVRFVCIGLASDTHPRGTAARFWHQFGGHGDAGDD
jgi:hypothetical protein